MFIKLLCVLCSYAPPLTHLTIQDPAIAAVCACVLLYACVCHGVTTMTGSWIDRFSPKVEFFSSRCSNHFHLWTPEGQKSQNSEQKTDRVVRVSLHQVLLVNEYILQCLRPLYIDAFLFLCLLFLSVKIPARYTTMQYIAVL